MILSRHSPVSDAPVAQSAASLAPASPAQEQLWALAQHHPDRPIGNFPLALSMEGPLDAAVLARALNDVVARHDIFRTRFDIIDGRPIQVVSPSLNLPVPVIDLRLLPEGVREAQAFRLAREEAARAFEIRRLPLVRAQLFLFEQTRHILVLTLHRGIFDQDSLGILLRELSACYEARRSGGTSGLVPLPLQYAEYAAGQRRHFPSRESCLSWWSAKLSGDPAPLQLPADRPKSVIPGGGGRIEKHELSPALRSSVEALAQREGTNPFTIFLTAFQALLHRYTNRTDFVLGVVVSNRQTPETENLVGPFSIVVPFRADLSGNLPFRRLLERVRVEVLDVFAHSHAPFESLPGRYGNPAVSCPVQFSYQRTASELAGWPGLRLQELELESGTCQCELAFHVVESAAGLSVRATYDAELFSPAVIQRLLAHFGVLLQAAVSRPPCLLAELPLLTPAERHRLLSEWNNTSAAYPRDTTVHELFSARAAAEPESVAVASAHGKLSYRELDHRSNQLGRHLRAAAVRPGQLVGLCVERSPDLVVGLLGILKAGGAVLPLDPFLPDSAQARLMADARPNLILTHGPLRHSFPPDACRVLQLDAEAADIHRADEAGLAPVAGPDDFAWLASTAGTGGQSKSVELTHRTIVSSLHALRRLAGLTGADVVLAAAPLLSPDAISELLLPLIFGARVELASTEEMTDPGQLAARAATCRPTLLQAAPSKLRQMIEAGWTGDKSLRVLSSGEPLPRDLADRLLPCCGELWNLYGAAETTGGCLAAPVAAGRSAPVVGRPLANVQIHLLDSRLQPVPVGIPGEIYVGGDTLAARYRRQPTETASQFPADPFRRLPGTRLFRTGDLARRLPNGEIEFLGRLDQRTACRLAPVQVTRAEPVPCPSAPDPLSRAAAPEPLSFARNCRPGPRALISA